jgi:predicted MFS family arabinose efflux permease
MLAGGPELGPRTLLLVTATIAGIVTWLTMLGPLLVDLSRDLGVSLGRAGLLATITAVSQAIGSPFGGLLGDRLGRRPMIILSLSILGSLSLVAAAAPNFLVLAVTRFIAGFVGAVGPMSLAAALGDLCRAERLARAMTWFNLGFSLAAIAGVPLMGALGGAVGWRGAFASIGVLLLLLALGIRLWFPGVPPPAAGSGVFATYRALSGVRGLLPVLGANVLERSLFSMVTIYLPAFLMLGYAMTAVRVAPVLTLVAVGTIAGNVLGGWLGDRLSRPLLFIAAQLLAGLLGFLLFGGALVLPAAVAVAALLVLANSLSRPGFLAYGAELAPSQRGALFGLLGLSNQLGFVIGTALGAAIIGDDSYTEFALVTLAQGLLAGALAVPLLRARPSSKMSS